MGSIDCCSALTVGGVIYAVFKPVEYHQGLIPPSVVAPELAERVHPSTIMAVRQLGSCKSIAIQSSVFRLRLMLKFVLGFLLLALLASVFLRRTANVLRARPAELEAIVASCERLINVPRHTRVTWRTLCCFN